MRSQTIVVCLVASLCLYFSQNSLGQDSNPEALKSVLKPSSDTDDLRALIDLSEPTTTTTSNAASTDVTSDLLDAKTPTTLDEPTNTSSLERIATPAPVNEDSEATTAPATPTPSTNPTINSKAAATTETPSNVSLADPVFDLGLVIRDDVANAVPIVRGVLVGSPAAQAGVRTGDRIRAVGSNPTRSSYGFVGRTCLRRRHLSLT